MNDSPDPLQALNRDPLLAPLIEVAGPKTIEPAPDFFRRFVISIIRQQISMQAADAIITRLDNGVGIDVDSCRTIEAESLTNYGVSQMKAETIRRVAETFETDGWSYEYFRGHSNEAIIEEMTSIKGVGPWTAKMQLIFSLGREDVFPIEDLGIRNGMEHLCNESLELQDMRKIADRWRPFRSYASLYLWDVVD